jgi:hypothetical protein
MEVVHGLVTPNAVKTIGQAHRQGGRFQPRQRGGARNNVDPAVLLEYHLFIASLPREIRHYMLTATCDLTQVVLKRYWRHHRIHWRFLELRDPLYYCEQAMLRSYKRCGTPVPEGFRKRKPLLGFTRGRKYVRSLNLRIGKDRKDDCAFCIECNLYIHLSEESGASSATREKAIEYRALKKEHMRRADAANWLQVQEQKRCIERTVKEREFDPLVCNCGQTPFVCRCRFLTRPGTEQDPSYELLQQDKGAKLPLPYMPKVGSLFYFSHINFIFEHVTAYSQLGKTRRTAYGWDELIATGGPNNMLSVNYYHLCHYPSGRDGLVIWVDNCFKELKNWTTVFYSFWLVHVKKMFKWVVIRYYEKGHSAMGGDGCDSTQAKIGLAGKNTGDKVVPDDWLDTARAAADGQLNVVDFAEGCHFNWALFFEQFFSVRTKEAPITRTRYKVCSRGERVDLRTYRYLQVHRDQHQGWVQAFTEMDSTLQPVLIDVIRLHSPLKYVESPVDERLLLLPNQITFNQAKGLLNSYVYMNKPQRQHYKPKMSCQNAIWSVQPKKDKKKQRFVELRDKVMNSDPGDAEMMPVLDPMLHGELAGGGPDLEAVTSLGDDEGGPDLEDHEAVEGKQAKKTTAQRKRRRAKRATAANQRKQQKRVAQKTARDALKALL